MKKITLFILTILLGNIVMAQLPANEFFRYEFTNGSNANTASTSAADLTGVFTSITDRNNSAGDAADISEVLNGANFGSINVNLSTLSFWIKHSTLSGSQRIAQIYGDNGCGYRVEMDGTNLIINTRVEGGGMFASGVMTTAANIDDNNWHHIVVRTDITTSFDAIIFDLSIDGVDMNIPSNIIGPGVMITNFLKNATFIIDPITGTYSGDVDDVYAYKAALSSSEIVQLYNYSPAPPPTRYYVDMDATGNNDGSSWTDAYTNLQNAFNDAYEGMEIWVAEGSYKRVGTNRSLAFLWEVDSLEVYGGFNGTETMLSQRDWMVNRTIMSGDIGTQGDITDNCYAVFVGPFGSSSNVINTALLDGFVIQDGNADFNGAHEFGATGAAFYSVDYTARMDFHNCEFSNNTAKYSAFFTFADTEDFVVNVDACVFKDNSGRVGSAILTESHGQNMFLNVTNSLFYNNESKDMGTLGLGLGGVVYLEAKNATLTGLRASFINTTFANNPNNGTHASNFESTIVCFDAAAGGGSKHLDVDNCIFWGNTGDSFSVIENPNSNSSFNSITIDNTLSEFSTFPGIATTSNILTTNPMFTDVVNNDYTLQGSSPAIDAGSQTGLTIPNLDLAGNARVFGSEIDMGCYEAACGISVNVTNTNDELNATTGFTSYQWYLNGTAVTGANSADFTPTENGQIYVEVTDGGCTVSTTPTLYCLAFPDVIITQNGSDLELAAGFSTYDWSLDGVLIAGENSNTITPTQDGEYTIEVTDQYGCGDFTTFNYCGSISVTVTESNGTLTATTGYAAYQWFQDGTAISGATSETYTTTADGNYSCEVTDNGCTSSSNTVTISTTSIKDHSFQNLNVYPNPTSDFINLELTEGLTSIRIMDLSGKTVKVFDANVKQLNIAEFNSGIYFLEVANTESRSVIKIIKK